MSISLGYQDKPSINACVGMCPEGEDMDFMSRCVLSTVLLLYEGPIVRVVIQSKAYLAEIAIQTCVSSTGRGQGGVVRFQIMNYCKKISNARSVLHEIIRLKVCVLWLNNGKRL